MVKAVIFDFWGTIVENGTFSPLRQSWSILRVRMRFSEFVQKFEDVFMTEKFADQNAAFNKVFEEFSLQPKQFVIDKLIGVWNKNRLLAKPFSEAVKVLDELKKKKIKIALISNADCFSVEPLLEKFDLAKYFDSVHLSYTKGYLKTNPKSFEAILKELKLKPEDVLMVGDSLQTEIEGAKKAGIKPILLDRRGRRDYPEKIADLTGLKEFLK